MKKKQVNLYKSLLLLIGILFLGITLSCSNNIQNVRDFLKDTHQHSYSSDWASDSSGHWHACSCGEKTEFAEHVFGEYVSNNDATTVKDGTKTRTCSECGRKDTVTDEGSKIIVPEGFVFVSGRKLTIPDLIVSDHEVTRGEYKAVMGKDPSIASAYDKDGNELEGDAVLNTPVNRVNWYNALVYCNKLSMQENLTPCYSIDGSTNPDDWGERPTSSNSTWDTATCDFNANGYRLPTDAEWEWLARGGENYTYAGSDTIDDVAWYKENTNSTGTREVKTKAPNGYGLYDMSGNVYEWCWDSVASGYKRVYRGGCWGGEAYHACVFNCEWEFPRSCYDFVGFRVVRLAN